MMCNILGHGGFHLTLAVTLRLSLLDTDRNTHDDSTGELIVSLDLAGRQKENEPTESALFSCSTESNSTYPILLISHPHLNKPTHAELTPWTSWTPCR